jgi:HAMP domain-containing protein
MVTTIILIGVNFLILLIMYFVFKRKIEKALTNEEILRSVREEVDQMIVELNRTTNRNIGLIEESINRLSDVLRRADKSMMLLGRQQEQQKKSEEVYSSLKPKHLKIDNEKPKKEEKTIPEQVMELYNKGFSPTIISNKLDISVGEIETIISIHGRKG